MTESDITFSKKTKLTLTYDGKDFCGWQVQKDVPTVQGTLQDAIEKITGTRLPVCGCSRTDSGVHALNYVCHTDYISVPEEKIPLALNTYLPSGIAVKKAEFVPADFHARYSCTGKEYIYKILNSNYLDPFLYGRVMFYPKALDDNLMNTLSGAICGKHDFSAFMAQGSPVNDTVRTVKYCDVSRQDDIITVRVCADGFLYNMVRIIVGTLVWGSQNGLCENDIKNIIDSRDRKNAGFTAEACGLYLNRIFY